MLNSQLSEIVADAYAELEENFGANGVYGKEIKVTVNKDSLLNQFSEILNISVEEIVADGFAADVEAVIAKYENEYNSASPEITAELTTLDYESKYSFITDSFATDENYVYTDYTSDVGNIAMVTYSDGVNTVRFILNYNIYSVNVNLDGTVYKIDKLGFVRL